MGLPCEGLQQHATEQRTQGTANAHECHPDPHGLTDFSPGKRRGEDRKRRGHDQGGAETHHGLRSHEVRGRGRPDGGGRSGPEYDEAHLERALASVTVAERTHGEKESAEDDGVGVDDPLEVHGRCTECAHERGKRDGQRGIGYHDDDQGEIQHAQRPPTLPVDVRSYAIPEIFPIRAPSVAGAITVALG